MQSSETIFHRSRPQGEAVAVPQHKAKRTWRPSPLEVRVSEMARRTAERQAARILWPRLYEAREEYLKWEAFVLWVRSIEEAEGGAPEWLAKVVDRRCPDFSKFVSEKSEHRRQGLRFLWYHLQRWNNDRIFGKPWREGWMSAVGFYAARDLACLRNHAYWEYCENAWERKKPTVYPSFREWVRASEHCSDRVLDACEMREEKRQLIKLMRRVASQTLRQALKRYVEWEVFAYWTRTALEAGSILPGAVGREVKRRCPGFLEADAVARAANPREESHCRFNRLVEWIEDHEFAEAQKRGWFEVLLYQAQLHPRHSRVVDYWHDWEAGWAQQLSAKYPSFKKWRDSADCYTFEAGER